MNSRLLYVLKVHNLTYTVPPFSSTYCLADGASQRRIRSSFVFGGARSAGFLIHTARMHLHRAPRCVASSIRRHVPMPRRNELRIVLAQRVTFHSQQPLLAVAGFRQWAPRLQRVLRRRLQHSSNKETLRRPRRRRRCRSRCRSRCRCRYRCRCRC